MSFFNLTFNNNENTEIVDKFIDEYAQWHNTGKTPDMGSLDVDRKSTRLNSSHDRQSRMPSSA